MMMKQILTPTDRVTRDLTLSQKARSRDKKIDEDKGIGLILQNAKTFRNYSREFGSKVDQNTQ